MGASPTYDLELISVSFAPPAGTCTGAPCPRAEPGGSTVVTVRAKNTGNATWLSREVSMPLENVNTNDPGWTDTALSLLAATSGGKVGTFQDTPDAPGQIGLHGLTDSRHMIGRVRGDGPPAPACRRPLRYTKIA